jgi:hypothetical protein
MQNPLHAYSRKAPCAARGRSAARDVKRATTLPLKRLPRRRNRQTVRSPGSDVRRLWSKALSSADRRSRRNDLATQSEPISAVIASPWRAQNRGAHQLSATCRSRLKPQNSASCITRCPPTIDRISCTQQKRNQRPAPRSSRVFQSNLRSPDGLSRRKPDIADRDGRRLGD